MNITFICGFSPTITIIGCGASRDFSKFSGVKWVLFRKASKSYFCILLEISVRRKTVSLLRWEFQVFHYTVFGSKTVTSLWVTVSISERQILNRDGFVSGLCGCE